MVLCGVLMGMGFDTYHVFTRGRRFPAGVIFLLDVLFWLASVALVFVILLEVNSGVVRFPIFLGMAAGAWAYFALGSRTYVRILRETIRWTKRLFRMLMTVLDFLIVRPVLLVYRVLWLAVSFLLTMAAAVGRGLGRVLFVLMRPFVTTGQKMGKSMNRAAAGLWGRLKKWVKRNRAPDDK